MVHPGLGIAVGLSFPDCRALVSEEVLYARNELRGAVLGQVMHEAAPWNAASETVAHYEVPVSCDGVEMTEESVHGISMVRAL